MSISGIPARSDKINSSVMLVCSWRRMFAVLLALSLVSSGFVYIYVYDGMTVTPARNQAEKYWDDIIENQFTQRSVIVTRTPPTKKNSTECNTFTRVVFIKTHKTASSTTASIIQRFGYTRNLSFVVPSRTQIISSTSGFNRSMLNSRKYPPLNGGKHYDILTNHVRYNRHEMEAVIPNATYITILRHPVNQIVSAFSYFRWAQVINRYHGNKNALVTFMENPAKFPKYKMRFWWQSHNGQLYDLGFRNNYANITDDVIHKYIEILDKEMDLVLITEYFDESLLVLKKQLCWSMDDIIYIPKGVGTSRHILTQQTRDRIMQWNRGDFLLYEHFNRTLWEKITDYGPAFERDLQQFRDKRHTTMEECVDPSVMNTKDPRERKYVLKSNAADKCINMWLSDVRFTALIRDKQGKSKNNIPNQGSLNKSNVTQ
ncbi:galactose-3-O-sulfotransferase 2-like [Saccoglossus kowalevskii]